MDATKPEANGRFIIYDVPDFPGAETGTERRAFYIAFPIDHPFPEGNEEINFYTAFVAGEYHVIFKFPAWPHALYPDLPGTKDLYEAFVKVS